MILEHPPLPLACLRPDAPEGLEPVLRKALRSSRDRWKSAAAMGEALRPFVDGPRPRGPDSGGEGFRGAAGQADSTRPVSFWARPCVK